MREDPNVLQERGGQGGTVQDCRSEGEMRPATTYSHRKRLAFLEHASLSTMKGTICCHCHLNAYGTDWAAFSGNLIKEWKLRVANRDSGSGRNKQGPGQKYQEER